MYRSLLLLVFSFLLLSGQENYFKKELVVIYEDFSLNNWTILSLSENDTANSFALSSIKARSPFSSMAIMASYPYAQDEWIISPRLDFSGSTNTPILTFFEDHDFWYQSKATHEVLYALVDNPGKDDFAVLESWNLDNHVIVQNGFNSNSVLITLDGLAGENTVYIAFRYISAEAQYDDNWYIDDLTISQNILYDGSIVYSSLPDKGSLSTTSETPLTVYSQNRGLEPATLPVVAQLYDYLGRSIWSQSLNSKELESWGKDTLLFSIPAVFDSSHYDLKVYTDLSEDQYRNNDTLAVGLNTFVSVKTSVSEAFLNSENYFSEGPALIVDSLAKIIDINVIPVWHFALAADSLYAPASGVLAEELSVSRSSTIVLDRQTRFYEPYTSEQDWAKRVATIKTQVLVQANQKSSIDISGLAFKNPTDSTYTIKYEITQTANLPPEQFKLEIWALENKKAYTWLRLDTLYNRAMDRIHNEDFSSGQKDSTILSDSIYYKFPVDGSILFSPPDSSVFVLLVKNLTGTIINATNFNETSLKTPVTGVDDDRQRPDTFIILGNYPNPFNPSTALKFNIPRSGNVDIRVYSVTGQLVYSSSKLFKTGQNTWTWDSGGMGSGTYFIMLKSGSMTRIHKILLIK